MVVCRSRACRSIAILSSLRERCPINIGGDPRMPQYEPYILITKHKGVCRRLGIGERQRPIDLPTAAMLSRRLATGVHHVRVVRPGFHRDPGRIGTHQLWNMGVPMWW